MSHELQAPVAYITGTITATTIFVLFVLLFLIELLTCIFHNVLIIDGGIEAVQFILFLRSFKFCLFVVANSLTLHFAGDSNTQSRKTTLDTII